LGRRETARSLSRDSERVSGDVLQIVGIDQNLWTLCKTETTTR
jgi:hypothetical protein